MSEREFHPEIKRSSKFIRFS